ncbi:general transcription factor 3C polypeptide 4-like protein [Labeo rohita]|uniref:General transcription factor 3C polypeptide 4-like protein n=1 Tax=Labeo rohita TaxID=84645 RepID=A0A498MY80_LABRO|nr:general transcription factor 3C polypeptide 4-like protein [Labeo rohita]RXN32418.1 general transcription factor 3C polypeptide 4-like protein [Labeo rohita]
MAALGSNTTSEKAGTASEGQSGPDNDFCAGQVPVVLRDPAIKLLSPVSGLEPLSWAEDHRLAASSTNSVSIMELVSDIHSLSQNLVLHRSHIPVPDSACDLKVGPEKEVQTVKESFAKSKDPVISQMMLIDRVIHPQCGRLHGVKYTSWSPLGCDKYGRCLLAFLTLDNRLTIHSSHSRLRWTTLLDLTELYGEMLKSRNYSAQNDGSPPNSIKDLDELQRRYRMQTPVRMEWSGLCSMQQVQTNNACKDVSTVLLAVLMENGDVVVWQFSLPPKGKDSVVSCNTIISGVLSPSVLTWWEYEHSGRKMSGLIVGSSVGPVKILPVNLKAVKGYFTLRQPVVLWQDKDQIPVHNIKCITLFHPHQKCNCSLVVAARGPYVFWCLLLISKAGLNVHNSHVTGLHSTPIISMTVCHNSGTIFTCSLDGKVKKLMPVFTDVAVEFKQEEIVLPEGVVGRRIHGISMSPNGAYLALISNEGMISGLHPVNRTYQVQFVTLKTPDEAAAELLESQMHSLFSKTDMLDLLRWRILKDKSIPLDLQNNLDEKLRTSGSTYLWRLKLFLLRTLYKSMQKTPSEHLWRPTHRELVADEEAGGGEEEMAEISALEELRQADAERQSSEEQMREISSRIEEVESQLIRENMKKVLGEVYLHTCVTQNTCIPTKGVCDFLTNDPANEDRAAKVLIGHIMNKMNKQTFPEYCSLCKEILPFTDCKRAECKNGHRWLRCALSYQACQGVTYRRCLLQDSIASVAEPEGGGSSQSKSTA